MKLQLKPNANTNYEDARDMYNSYRAYVNDYVYEDGELIDDERAIALKDVEFDWLDDGDYVASAKIVEELGCSRDTATSLLDTARRVRDDMEVVESYLATAVLAYKANDLEAVIEALDDASNVESGHGDDPATSALRKQLLRSRAMTTKSLIGNMMVRSEKNFIVYGEVRGMVAEVETYAEAVQALIDDQQGCRKQGGYSDACVYQDDGTGHWGCIASY